MLKIRSLLGKTENFLHSLINIKYRLVRRNIHVIRKLLLLIRILSRIRFLHVEKIYDRFEINNIWYKLLIFYQF